HLRLNGDVRVVSAFHPRATKSRTCRRFGFGRPTDSRAVASSERLNVLSCPWGYDVGDGAKAMANEKRTDSLMNLVAVVGRILIALIFVRAGINKIGSIDATAAEMAKSGIPLSNILVFGAIMMELGGGLLLMVGLLARWAALALFFYTLTLALIFHAYWAVPDAQARLQASFFFGHLSMMGGMLVVVAFGAGAYSLDALVRRKA
ncbi:MAG: DoxX family protein, partial [Xanthobacteraceae bacterium]